MRGFKNYKKMGLIISKTKMRQRDPLEIMRFTFCADKENFVSAFAKIGLPVKTEEDLKTLAQWIKDKRDINGEITNTHNQKLNFSILDLVNNVKIRHNSVLNCGIKYID